MGGEVDVACAHPFALDGYVRPYLDVEYVRWGIKRTTTLRVVGFLELGNGGFWQFNPWFWQFYLEIMKLYDLIVRRTFHY